jgi:hypothetical protein
MIVRESETTITLRLAEECVPPYLRGRPGAEVKRIAKHTIKSMKEVE